MIPDVAIRLEGVGKCYHLYDAPRDRLLQILRGHRHQYYREFWAVRGVSLDIRKGEVIGVIGRNGAGKSTLLQLICGTLHPTEGDISVNGRIAAILELGAGFNPEYSGRENIYLSAALMGLSHLDIDAKYADIVSFSGIGDFIEQPVKSYSSGMYVRLAFSVATSVDPEILIIDEALSVGDGEFSRKSFDRIMELRDSGATIVFCSHSMYQIEAICDRTCWLKDGSLFMLGHPARVVSSYTEELDAQSVAGFSISTTQGQPLTRQTRITSVLASSCGVSGRQLELHSEESDLSIQVEFLSDLDLPIPTVAILISTRSGQVVTSCGSLFDQTFFQRNSAGMGRAEIVFPQIPLLKGEYTLSVFLLCEKMIHLYDSAEYCVELKILQQKLELGLVKIPHFWSDGSTVQAVKKDDNR